MLARNSFFQSTGANIPLSQAAFNSSKPSSSSIHHCCHSLAPMAMVPRIGDEMRRPEVPSWTYSTFVAERLARREGGVGMDGGRGIFGCSFVGRGEVDRG